MRRGPLRAAPLLALVPALLLAGGRGAGAEEPRAVRWEAPARVTQLARADVDGDGVTDVLLASGRAVAVWSGGKGRPPGAAPRWSQVLDPAASFADADPGASPALRVLADGATYRLALDDGVVRTRTPLGAGVLDWRDADGVTFLDLVQADGGLLVPTREGWRLERPDADPLSVTLRLDRHVAQGGPFLEDTAEATVAHPRAVVGRSAVKGHEGSALWGFSGDALVARDAAHEVRYDVAFLPREGDRRLVDLDGDGRPDVMHRKTTNRDGQYGFFHTRPVSAGASFTEAGTPVDPPPPLAPARAILRLSGFHLAPDLVDLDGDGLLDFVITTIEIDAKNTLRALASGTVVARTKAFLNRADAPGGRPFRAEPDAAVVSEIGVELRFTYAGTIQVERSLTIIVDGDYDGDGRLDLATRTGPDTLRVRRGRADGVFEPEGRDVAIPALGDHTNVEGYAVDMDGDGRDEIVLVYRTEGEGPERVVHLTPWP